jgi:hypothetical protein
MSLVVLGTAISTIAPWLGEWAIVGIAGKLGEGAVKRFKPDEMALLLKQAIATAEAAQPPTGALFDRCHYDGYKGVKKFLEQFFLSGEVLKELQKPLQDKGKPDLDILITAFKESAKQHPEAKEYLLNSLPLWMETFVESYFGQIKGICFQVAREQYLEQLAHQIRSVKFVGIAVSDSDIEQPEFLAKIFVMPDVREEKRERKRSQQFSAEEQAYFEGISRRNLYYPNLLEEQKEWAMRDRSAPRIPAQKVINLAQKKAVVLGAPGSGKTMLASYFALMLCGTAQSDPTQIGLEKDADYLPVVVRIRDWILQPKMGLLEYLRSNAESNLSCKELPTGFFEHWLERGQALILLDGLDEVVDEAQRRKVAEQIETFLHQYQDNPAIITSRPAGYRWDFFNLDEFPHYTLESFDDKQVATFIDHWYDSRLKEDPAQADRRKADLQKAFARNERIRLLAKNPLLLTIITLIHRYQAELPRQRCKLYEKAVETLLTSWDSGKEIKLYSQVLLFLKSDDLLYILKKLAYWIHTQGSTGETEGGTLIDKDELIQQLRVEIQKITACKTHEAKAEAERFVDFIQKRTGLLNEQGRDRYAFVHKTFQEYLTAEEIYEIDESGEDTEIIEKHFREHLHDPHWREVLLLLVSKLKGKKAKKAIQTVLEAESEYEQWLHRDLLFAGWCLTEDPSRLTTVAKDFVGGILDRLVELEVENVDQIGSKISDEVEKILHCFGETTVERNVWERLQGHGNKIKHLRLIEFQAALGYQAAAVESLLKLLENQHGVISLGAVEILVQLGNSNEKVVSCLSRLIHSEQSFIFCHAAKILFQSGNSCDELIQHFLVMLDIEDSLIRIRSAHILVQLGDTSEQLVSNLISLLKDKSSYVCCNAAIILGQLGSASPEIISVLLSLLNNGDSYVRSNAASALGNLGKTNPKVVKDLLPLLYDEDFNVRCSAAVSLGILGEASSEVINSLFPLLSDQYSQVSSGAALALIELGEANPEIVNALLLSLCDESFSVRPRVSPVGLGYLAKTSDRILPKVLQYLKQNPNHDGIGNAIDCLWSIVVE